MYGYSLKITIFQVNSMKIEVTQHNTYQLAGSAEQRTFGIPKGGAYKSKIADYFKTQPIERVWLFGSLARGKETPISDVDILVQFDEDGVRLLKHAAMICDLEKILDRHTFYWQETAYSHRGNAMFPVGEHKLRGRLFWSWLIGVLELEYICL